MMNHKKLIHAYRRKNARLRAENRKLQELNRSQRNGPRQLRGELKQVERERDAPPEVLAAIDELVEFARPRMTISNWLGYVNVLSKWRNAQKGE